MKGIDKNEANMFGFRAILGGVQISREARATPCLPRVACILTSPLLQCDSKLYQPPFYCSLMQNNTCNDTGRRGLINIGWRSSRFKLKPENQL